MISDVTLDMILEFPREILRKSEQYDEYAELLRKETYSKYDFKEIKQQIVEKFNRFKDAKYTYKFSLESNIKLTQSYTLREGSLVNRVSDPTGSIVAKAVDEQLWITKFYYSIMKIASTLTLQEATYLVDTFFSNKSEDVISEKLRICRNTLQNIKKSCLVKIWLEIESI